MLNLELLTALCEPLLNSTPEAQNNSNVAKPTIPICNDFNAAPAQLLCLASRLALWLVLLELPRACSGLLATLRKKRRLGGASSAWHGEGRA